MLRVLSCSQADAKVIGNLLPSVKFDFFCHGRLLQILANARRACGLRTGCRSLRLQCIPFSGKPGSSDQMFPLFSTAHLSRTLQVAAGLLCCLHLQASSITLDFENLTDLEAVDSQFEGLSFQNAIALATGISLNELEFPPRSGSVVISDDGAPITILFSSPVPSVSGSFTYTTPLTLTAFDAANQQVAQAISAFGNNLACLAGPPCSGDLASSPNELLGVTFASGIFSLTIVGDRLGGSFALDDLVLGAAETIPEPPSIYLSLIALGALFMLRRRDSQNL